MKRLLSIFFMGLYPLFLYAEILKLDQYLEQVKSQNDEVKGSTLASYGALLRSTEARTLLSPSIFADANFTRNERENFSPAIQGTRTDITSYSLGLGKLTTFGLRAEAGYRWGSTSIEGANPVFVTTPAYREASPYVEFTQDFWRNGFGREVRANQELIEAQALANHYRESFRNKQILTDAEFAYWRLSLARENLQIQQSNLSRAEKLRNWSEKQMNMQLADRSDYLQTVATLETRRLELATAKLEEAQAARSFNSLRQVDSDQVSEELEDLSKLPVEEWKVPVRAMAREDLLEAQQVERMARASALLGIEKNRGLFQLYGNLSLNGRDPDYGEAFSESMSTDQPVYTVGVRMSAAIDFENVPKAKEGYRQELAGAELKYKSKQFQQERLWRDLSHQFIEAKTLLNLSKAAEQSQRAKIDYERDRHSRGRTTIYQVLQFEQDYANAQLARIRSQARLVDLYSGLKMFGE